jgi:hypothetical protein
LGVEKSVAAAGRTADGILGHIRDGVGKLTEPEICEAVEGKTAVKRRALRDLVERGKVLRDGTGKKGDPYVYNLSPKCLFPCSHLYTGNKKTRIGKNGLSR